MREQMRKFLKPTATEMAQSQLLRMERELVLAKVSVEQYQAYVDQLTKSIDRIKKELAQ